jgi:glycerol-3-phosphate acyltransferase PlsY
VLAGAAAVIGHNYSIFLAERKPDGGWRLRGGAGGATTVGGAMGLWFPSLFIIVPLAGLVLFGIGYASVATMSAALLATIIFAVRAALGYSPWAYAGYGLLTEVLLVIALLPNIRRLQQGTERRVGWRAKRKPSAE